MKRKRLFAFAAAALGVALALVLAELGLRLVNPMSLQERASWHFLLWEAIRPSANPERVWEHRPGYARRLVGYSVRINSLGMRGPEAAAEKQAGTIRIFAAGDSMTFGMSGREEDSYPAQLLELLAARHPGRAIEVLNGGVLGYTTLQEEALLREAVPRLEPDLVVMWWFHNDVLLTGAANPASQEGELRTLIGLKQPSFGRRAIHAGYEIFPRLTALARAATRGRGDGDAADAHLGFDPESNPEGLAANLAALRRIAGLCRENGTKLLVYSFGRYVFLADLCAAEGVPYATTVDRAGAEHEDKYSISREDPHFNRAGNRAVAETLAGEAEKLVFVP